jgi:hypothetical protein
MLLAGCGDSTDTRVIDPNSGQLIKALSLTFETGYQQQTNSVSEGAATYIGGASITALTSAVEVYEIHVTTSQAVKKIDLNIIQNSIFTSAGFSEQTTATMNHVIKARNGGYLFRIDGDGNVVQAEFYVDTLGIGGNFTLSVTGARVKVNGGNEMQLSTQNRSKTVFVEEGPRIDFKLGTANTTFKVVGTNDVWVNYSVENQSAKQSVFLSGFYIYTDKNNLTMQIVDANNSVIGTMAYIGRNTYYLGVTNLGDTRLLIDAGQTKAYKVVGNPNGNKAIFINSLQVNSQTPSGLNTGTGYSVGQTVTYP